MIFIQELADLLYLSVYALFTRYLRLIWAVLGTLTVMLVTGNMAGLGKPPERGIISLEAAARIRVISLIREG